MCMGLAMLNTEVKNAQMGIPHSHQHSASEAAHMKELHSNYRDLSVNGGLEAALEAEKVNLHQA